MSVTTWSMAGRPARYAARQTWLRAYSTSSPPRHAAAADVGHVVLGAEVGSTEFAGPAGQQGTRVGGAEHGLDSGDDQRAGPGVRRQRRPHLAQLRLGGQLRHHDAGGGAARGGRDISGEPRRADRVHPDQHRARVFRRLRAQRVDSGSGGAAGAGLVCGRHGVLEVGDGDVGREAGDLGDHVSAAAWHEQHAAGARQFRHGPLRPPRPGSSSAASGRHRIIAARTATQTVSLRWLRP